MPGLAHGDDYFRTVNARVDRFGKSRQFSTFRSGTLRTIAPSGGATRSSRLLFEFAGREKIAIEGTQLGARCESAEVVRNAEMLYDLWRNILGLAIG
jgi:hypothetical protein